MKIRIFQIDYQKDKKNLSFSGYEETAGNGGINPAVYRQAYGGTVNCSSLEDVFWRCNCDRKLPGYYGHSLSVSDVVEICDGENKGFYFCDSVGFKKIDFDISQTDHADMLKVLIVERGKKPYVAEIRDCLKAKQSAVGGLIEPVYFDLSDKALIFCDEEFLLKGYAPNRLVGRILIHGTFMIIGNGVNKNGENIEVSLTDEQISEFTEQFSSSIVRLKEEFSEEATQDFGISQA